MSTRPSSLRPLTLTFLLLATMLAIATCKPQPREEQVKEIVPETVAVEAPQPTPTDHSKFRRDIENAIATLQSAQGYEILDGIPSIKLFAYFSGHIPSTHPFPTIYWEPKTGLMHIFHQSYTRAITADSLSLAMGLFSEQLHLHGYKMPGFEEAPQNVNSIEQFLPDIESASKHFTQEQFAFLHDQVSPREAYAYLSGVSNTGRSFPLMVGVGFDETARLWVLGPNTAEEWEFSEKDSAFSHYQDLIVGLHHGTR